MISSQWRDSLKLTAYTVVTTGCLAIRLALIYKTSLIVKEIFSCSQTSVSNRCVIAFALVVGAWAIHSYVFRVQALYFSNMIAVYNGRQSPSNRAYKWHWLPHLFPKRASAEKKEHYAVRVQV